MFSRLVPGPLVRWFARPYVAGYSMEAGIEAALDAHRRASLLATLDVLGEDVHHEEQVAGNVALYRSLVDRLAGDEGFRDPAVRPSISLKPSAFTTGSREAAGENITRVAEHARARGVALTIDMEDRHWTDFTLDLSVRLFESGHDVGTVLQTRLHRTEADLERIPPGMRLRLVIGIYPEPASVALTDKRRMKERMVAHAARLLARGAHVEFATHDEPAIRRFVGEVAPSAPERSEVQMLLGVPRADLQRGLLAGDLGPPLPVRLYVPFAMNRLDATAYLRRRMEESPATMLVVLRNLFAGRDGRGRSRPA